MGALADSIGSVAPPFLLFLGSSSVDQIIADQFNVMGNSGTIRVLKRAGLDAVITAAGLVD